MVLVLQSSNEQQAALDALLEAQRNPASTHYHQWLTPEQFAEHFGTSSEDVQRIVNWLESQGMRIDEISPARRTITFSGTAAQVQSAFATSMRQYRVNGALHIANATDPSIPSALAPVVNGVLSLHDFRVQSMHSAATPIAEITYGNAHYLSPADLAMIYDLNALYSQGLNGSGESVAVVARSNINLSDVHSFRSTFGLPINDPQIIVNGNDPGTSNSDDLVEATLDAEYAGALAPNSTVKFVTSASTATTDGTYLSAQYIVDQNLAAVMTMSFGLCESQLGASGNSFVNALWQQAAAQGITVLVSAGDSGAAGCDDPSATVAQYGLAVNGLCSTPYDLCIGGTEFADTADPSLYWSSNNAAGTQSSALGYIPEVVWNESGANLWAGGGGSSIIYSKPAWQSGEGVPSDAMRDVPDLSLSAAGHDGYVIVLNGGETVVGGTSAATPALAGVFAMVAQSTGARQGAANPVLYTLASQQNSSSGPSIFHDITSGNNSVPGLTGYSAGAGYDLASGLGSVDADALVTNWSNGKTSPSIKLTLSASSLTASASSSAPITVQIADLNGFSAAVTLATSGLPQGITAKFSPATIAAPGSGSSSLQLTVASTVAAGNYSFNVVASSGTISSSATVTVIVLAPALTLSASASPISLLPGTSGTITITSATNSALNSAVALKATGLPTGVTAAFKPSSISAPGSGSSVLTLTTTSKASPGIYTVVVTATAGSISSSAQFTLNLVALSASVNNSSLSIAAGANGSLVLTVKKAASFVSAVVIAVAGLPTGVTASLSPASLSSGAGSVSITLKASTTATIGAANVSISATGGGTVLTVPVSLTITPQPTFTFTEVSSSETNPSTAAVSQTALSVQGVVAPTGANLIEKDVFSSSNSEIVNTAAQFSNLHIATGDQATLTEIAYSPVNGTPIIPAGAIFDVRTYGAAVDGKSEGDGLGAWSKTQSTCSMTSGSATLTCTDAPFLSTDMGKVIAVYGAGPTTSGYVQPLSTTISAYTSATTVTLAASASNAVTDSQRVVWGHDDTTADQTAITAACAAGAGMVYVPAGRSLTTGIQVTCSNVGITGAGMGISALENWNIAATPKGSALVYFYPPSNVDQGLKGSYLGNLELRQVQYPTNVEQLFTFNQTFEALAEYIRGIGYSHECAIDGGGAHNYGDVMQNSIMGPCGNGGPAYGLTTAGINYNGANVSVHDNTVSMSGQAIEYGGQGGTFEQNHLNGGNVAQTSAVGQYCFNLGSTGAGVFNVTFENNDCTLFSSAVHGGNSIGTMDRIYIDSNTFTDSGGVSVAGGLDTNSIPCSAYSPGVLCQNDTIVHGVSTIKNNTLISNTVPTSIQMDNANGLSLSASRESFDVEGNLHQVNYNWSSAGAAHIDIAGTIKIWKPSTAYTADSNGYAYPTVLNGYVYQANAAGTTGTTEPTWPLTIGGTVTDGSVTWTNAGAQPSWIIKNETFVMPSGYTDSSCLSTGGCTIVLDNPSREQISMTNVSGNYPWHIYLRTGNGRGSISGSYTETIPANSPYGDSSRYYNPLPSLYMGLTYTSRMATYFPLGAQILATTTSGNIAQVVTTAGWNAAAWIASNAYNAYSYVQAPTDNGHFYRNLAACTSGGWAPKFPISSGAIVIDNTCTWQESGPDAVFAPLASSPSTEAVGNITITPGGDATVDFASAAENGFASKLALSASGAPAGVSLKLSPSNISAGQGTSLTISTTTKTAAAVGTITVTATGGGQSKTLTIPLTVAATVKT